LRQATIPGGRTKERGDRLPLTGRGGRKVMDGAGDTLKSKIEEKKKNNVKRREKGKIGG